MLSYRAKSAILILMILSLTSCVSIYAPLGGVKHDAKYGAAGDQVTSNFGWDYGYQGETPWWNTWQGLWTGVDLELYNHEHVTTNVRGGQTLGSARSPITDLITKSPWVDVRAFGAKVDNSTDDTAAWLAAIASLGSNPGAIFCPGISKTTETITFRSHRQGIVGLGPKLSGINFVPSSEGKSAVKYQLSTSNYIAQSFIRDFSIQSSDTTLNKIGLSLVDVSGFNLRNVQINQIIGNSSIGLNVSGREICSFCDLTINANKPVVISPNPNGAYEACDSFNFHNAYFIGTDTNPIFTISSGAIWHNLSFTGSNTWALGGYGLFWQDASLSQDVYNLSIENLLWEQSTYSSGYLLYLTANTGQYLNKVTLNGVHADLLNAVPNFIFMRNVKDVVMNNCNYSGTGYFMNIDNTVSGIVMNNFSTLSTLGLIYSYGNVSGFFNNDKMLLKGKAITSGTTPPSTGTWNQGDICINSAPSVGQPKGWRCTSGGVPGTWVSEGTL